MTTNYSEVRKSSFRKTGRNAVDDDDGAGKGAAVGAAVSMIRKGDADTARPDCSSSSVSAALPSVGCGRVVASPHRTR